MTTTSDALARVLVPASEGRRQIPLCELARVKVASGPAMIRDEDGLLTGYVFVDVAGRDVSSYLDEASRVVREHVKLPPGYAVLWSGQYEAMARVRARLTRITPTSAYSCDPSAMASSIDASSARTFSTCSQRAGSSSADSRSLRVIGKAREA
jgi:Cu/Ag efflux pump CusA